MKTKIFLGGVLHTRFNPKRHSFYYPAYFVQFSLNEINKISNPFFSINRFNLFSLYFKDYGKRNGGDLNEFVNDIVGKDYDDVILQTTPRILGYSFNPVNFWYIFKENRLINIIAEVSNTFGEHCWYLLSPEKLHETKVMHVSPFNKIEGNYQFNFVMEKNYCRVDIHYFVNNKKLIYASVDGKPIDWNKKNLLKLFFRNPLRNILVIVFIHWQAIKLYMKGIPFYGKNGVPV